MATTPKPLITVHGRIAGTVPIPGTDQCSVTFEPDTTHQGNAAWAQGTPALAMELNVKRAATEGLTPGDAVTITVTPA